MCSTQEAAHWTNGVSNELIKKLIAVNMITYGMDKTYTLPSTLDQRRLGPITMAML